MARKLTLKRELGLWQAMLTGVGIIFGAGIYALIGKAAVLAGNEIWLAFLLGAFVAAFTGLSYAELSSMFPKAGAEYVYTEKAFGKRAAFLVGWLVIASGVIAAATVALGFGGYFGALFNIDIIPAAIGIVIVSSIINFIGVKQSAEIGVLFTLIESAGLVLIILIGLPYFGSVNYFENPFGIAGVLKAAVLIFFAYIGFEEITRLSEETKTPRKIIPKALIGAIIISTIVYILVSVSAVSIINWNDLGKSNAPIADVASKAFGGGAFLLFSVIALFATSNTVLLMLLATSRIAYGMAKDSPLPDALGKIHSRTRTPWVAILTVMVFSILLILPGRIEVVANATDFIIFTIFAAINGAVIWLRYKEPKTRREFKVPGNVNNFPVLSALGILISALMLTNFSTTVTLIGIGVIVFGILVYTPMEEFEEKVMHRKKV